MIKQPSAASMIESPVTVQGPQRDGDGAGIGKDAADAVAEIARLAIDGAGRVELSACATRWLERMVPGCRAVVVEAVDGREVGEILADACGSDVPKGTRFLVGEGSVIAEALGRAPGVARAGGAELDRTLSGVTPVQVQDSMLACAGIVSKAGVRAALVILADRESLSERAEMDVVLQILADHLAVGWSVARNRAAAAGANDAIVRAKMEWERTVDALADIVCLLDANGRIVRANRVVEQWGLGQVAQLIGRTPHEILHPGCSRARCSLASAIARASQELQKDGPAQFECRDDDRDMDLHFSFRPMLSDAVAARSTSEVQTVLVVSNVSELHRARVALNQLNEDLELKVRERTQELREANRGLRNEVVRRKAAEAALRASNSERALLSEQLIAAQENERHRLARELHDAVGQSLSAVKYSIERATEMLRRPGLGDAVPVLMQAVRGTQDAADSIRTIATSLRPTTLDDMGAASAVAGFCRQFADVYRNIAVDLRMSATDADVPDRLATALFRSAQELLNNVAKHAGAKSVILELRREPLLLVLEVRDDGIGIPASRLGDPQVQGHGIRNLKERAEMTGGDFQLMPGPVRGTVARISWPLLHDEITEGRAI